MSLAAKKVAVAQALSTVEGITGHAYMPEPPQELDGWMSAGSYVTDTRVGQMMLSFSVLVMTPQGDEPAAFEWFDSRWEEIADALVEHGYLDRVDLVGLNQQQWAVQFSLRSE